MPNRIESCFQTLRARKRAAFIAYVTAGDPAPAATPALVDTLEHAGVDIVELGIPFSDPLADGATIQAAAGRALAAGTTVSHVLDIVREIRTRSEVPIVLFTYLNPIFSYGIERFESDAVAAGADGLLILDLPPDETAVSTGPCGLLRIQLIAPTTPPHRMQTIAGAAAGFIYYVSREGVTGEQAALAGSIADQVAGIRKHTTLPVAVGFGISTPDQAAEVARLSDAVVVGSAIVRQIANHASDSDVRARVESFAKPIAEAIHSVVKES